MDQDVDTLQVCVNLVGICSNESNAGEYVTSYSQKALLLNNAIEKNILQRVNSNKEVLCFIFHRPEAQKSR